MLWTFIRTNNAWRPFSAFELNEYFKAQPNSKWMFSFLETSILDTTVLARSKCSPCRSSFTLPFSGSLQTLPIECVITNVELSGEVGQFASRSRGSSSLLPQKFPRYHLGRQVGEVGVLQRGLTNSPLSCNGGDSMHFCMIPPPSSQPHPVLWWAV